MPHRAVLCDRGHPICALHCPISPSSPFTLLPSLTSLTPLVHADTSPPTTSHRCHSLRPCLHPKPLTATSSPLSVQPPHPGATTKVRAGLLRQQREDCSRDRGASPGNSTPSTLLCPLDAPGTVYVSKVKSKGRPAVYRFSLNASLPAPWQIVSPGDGEVPSFQVSPGHRELSHHHQGRGPQCCTDGHWPRRGRGGRVCEAGATAGT